MKNIKWPIYYLLISVIKIENIQRRYKDNENMYVYINKVIKL